MSLPEIATRQEWLAARKELLAKEKELARQRNALNAERRNLPMVEIEKDYVFEGPNGAARLIDLFDGRSQLIIYHFANHFAAAGTRAVAQQRRQSRRRARTDVEMGAAAVS